jgi:hypothetical protein
MIRTTEGWFICIATPRPRNKKNTYPIISELYAGHHEDATVTGFPIVVADERAFTGGAFALCDACHAEADVFWLVKGGGVQDGDAVPTGLDLDREMVLET